VREKTIKWGLLAILLVAFPLFFLGGPEWSSSPLYRNTWDSGHFLFFAALLIFIQRFVKLERPLQWLQVSLVILIIGAGIEWIQLYVGRDFSYADMFHDLVGVWLGLFWGQRPRPIVWVLRILALVLTLPALWIIVDSARLQWDVKQEFPLLIGFERANELMRITGNVSLSDSYHTQGARALKVNLDTREYSPASINKLLGDWRGYQYLSMDIYNPDSEILSLVLRISDYQHDQGAQDFNDRFNHRFELHSGWNSLRISLDDIRTAPKGREMQLEQVTNVELFSMRLPQARVYYWDNVRLE
jgi:VanZ family protein